MCARAYHALFMYNMLIRPTPEEMKTFGKPDFTIFNAGAFPVNRYTSYMSSSTSIDLHLRCVGHQSCRSKPLACLYQVENSELQDRSLGVLSWWSTVQCIVAPHILRPPLEL